MARVDLTQVRGRVLVTLGHPGAELTSMLVGWLAAAPYICWSWNPQIVHCPIMKNPSYSLHTCWDVFLIST